MKKLILLSMIVVSLLTSCNFNDTKTYKLTFQDGTTQTVQYGDCIPLEHGEVDCYVSRMDSLRPDHTYYDVKEFELVK